MSNLQKVAKSMHQTWFGALILFLGSHPKINAPRCLSPSRRPRKSMHLPGQKSQHHQESMHLIPFGASILFFWMGWWPWVHRFLLFWWVGDPGCIDFCFWDVLVTLGASIFIFLMVWWPQVHRFLLIWRSGHPGCIDFCGLVILGASILCFWMGCWP